MREQRETYVETVYTDSKGEYEDVPARTEPGHGVPDEDESQEPEERPDGVAATRSKASTCCHLESRPETENNLTFCYINPQEHYLS